jgi:CubicO group peptidase (beta-lactamase class C family)
MKCFFFLSLFGISLSSLAQINQIDETFIDSLMNRQYPADLPGAVILVAKDGKPAFRKAYGMADMEFQVSNKAEYLFPLLSLSKQFTAVCILQLVQEGKISLKDNIKTYLPNYNDHKRTITIEHLLTHTSGIPGFDENTDFMPAKDYQRDDLLNLFMNDSLLFEPGSNFAYTNSGYYLLALVIEKASGSTYPAYINEHIFKKAGMLHSCIATNDSIIANLVRPYSSTPGTRITNADDFKWSSLSGSGNIVSCADDLLKWDEALYDNSLIKQELLQKAFTPFRTTGGKSCNYGYGWATEKYQHVLFLSHRGNESGYATAGIRLPSLHTSIYILSNNGSSAAGSIATKIALHLCKFHLPLPGTYKASPQDLKALKGTYSIDRIGMRIAKSHCFVTNSNDSLFIQEPESEKILLLPVKKDQYMSSRHFGLYYRFSRGSRGDVTGLDVYNLPVNIGRIGERQKLSATTPDDMKFITPSEEELQKRCGKFDFGADAYATVTLKNSKLWVQFSDQPVAELFPESEFRFIEKNTAVIYEFMADSKGDVNKVIFHGALDHVGIRVK